MIDKSVIDKIYLTANITDVVGDFVSLRKKGMNYTACCPFHDEKTPSFIVSPSKGIFKCFGCGKAGNAVTFVMEHESFSYVEALKYLGKKYGIEVIDTEMNEEQRERSNDRESLLALNTYASKYFIDKLNNSSEGRNIGKSYFYERQFTDETIEKFQLGFSPTSYDAFSRKAVEDGYKEKYLVDSGLTIKRESGGYYDRFCGRVIFPIHSLSGSIIGFGGRILNSDKSKAKYLNSPESEIYHKSNTLYGIYFAKSAIVKEKKCILVEGYTDVISMMQSGIENVVASSGTSLTYEQIKLIARFSTNVTVIYDGDSAGIKASLRGIDMILKEGLNVRIVSLPNGEDPDSFAKTHTAFQTKTYIDENEEDFISFKTKLLMAEVANDPMGRAEVITDIVKSISVIPNEILRGQYARVCSQLMDEKEELISRAVERQNALNKDGEQGARYYDYKVQKDNYIKHNSVNIPISIDEQCEIEYLEKELISYLLKYGTRNVVVRNSENQEVEINIATEIINELEFDELKFETDVCQKIFDDYLKIKNEGLYTEDSVIMNSYINHIDPDVCKFVIELISRDETYRQSKIWQKLDRIYTEEDIISEAVPKTIAIYKLKMLTKIKKELMDILKKDKNNLDLLRQVNTINNERQNTCNKYSRIL